MGEIVPQGSTVPDNFIELVKTCRTTSDIKQQAVETAEDTAAALEQVFF